MGERGAARYSRNCQTFAASPAEPGELPWSLDRAELVIAALWPAGPVVVVRPLVTTVHHRGESIVRVHDGFDENQRVVWRAEGVLQVLDGFDDERSCLGVATEHLRQIGIGPVGDVVVGLGIAEVAAFDRISAVV